VSNIFIKVTLQKLRYLGLHLAGAL